MVELTVICSIVSVIMSCFALSMAFKASCLVIGLKNSTHKIEWRPIEDPFKNLEEDVEEFNEDPLKGI